MNHWTIHERKLLYCFKTWINKWPSISIKLFLFLPFINCLLTPQIPPPIMHLYSESSVNYTKKLEQFRSSRNLGLLSFTYLFFPYVKTNMPFRKVTFKNACYTTISTDIQMLHEFPLPKCISNLQVSVLKYSIGFA